jgi:tRNA threonylcarbamoyladenosine biosynthesis protein TsaE
MQLHLNSLNDLPSAAKSILNFAGDEKIFLFYGQMGAGKTTLINALCRGLGVTENTSSPTFAIVNEYRSMETNIFHFDFYRLKNQVEAMDIGFEEYLDSGSYCFIEWPEKIPGLLPLHHLRIDIQVTGEQPRNIIVDKIY